MASIVNKASPIVARVDTPRRSSTGSSSMTPFSPISTTTSHSSLSRQSRSSTSSAFSSTSSITTTTLPSAQRQARFEKAFTSRLIPLVPANSQPRDYFTAIHTQPCKIQGKALLNGRIYVTRYHLCFKSSTLGIRTKQVYALEGVVGVEKVSSKGRSKGDVRKDDTILVRVKTPGGIETVGYENLGDLEGLYEVLMSSCANNSTARTEVRAISVDEVLEEEVIVFEEDVGEESPALTEIATPVDTPKITNPAIPTDHLGALVGDTTIRAPVDKVYNLMYRNTAFLMSAYKKDRKLSNISIGDWKVDSLGVDCRSLNFVMAMNNPIGPSQTECIGNERVLSTTPDITYEIESYTQTPDIPTGKKFKIHTRTSLHTHSQSTNSPSTRLYATTQCEWSGSSFIEKYVTPAVIKGQREYHNKMVENVREWIKEHPEDFEESVGREKEEEEDREIERSKEENQVLIVGGVIQDVGEKMGDAAGVVVDGGKSMAHSFAVSGLVGDRLVLGRFLGVLVLLAVGFLYELVTGPGM